MAKTTRKRASSKGLTSQARSAIKQAQKSIPAEWRKQADKQYKDLRKTVDKQLSRVADRGVVEQLQRQIERLTREVERLTRSAAASAGRTASSARRSTSRTTAAARRRATSTGTKAKTAAKPTTTRAN